MGEIGFVGLVIGMVELLECVLGEAFVFLSVVQGNGSHAWMPVSAIDQFIEFGQSIFEIVEASHGLRCLLPFFDGDFQGHRSIA